MCRFPVPPMLLCTIVLLSACSAPPRNTPGSEAIQITSSRGEGTAKPVNITPLSTYEDEWAAPSAAGGDFAGAYTRLMIFSDLAASGGDEAENLAYKKRGYLTRAIVGKDFSLNLTVHVTVGAYESTVPLATIGHQSNSDGELWNRVIHHSKSDFPLFLVKNDGSASIPSVKIGVAGTKSYTSRGAATAVQVALGIAKATGAQANVVTRLSEQTTKDKARAVDDAISKLFASGIAEEHWTDRDLRSWSVGRDRPRGAKISFQVPSDEDDWNSTPRPVGNWTVTFDFPRPSIFADWRICGDSDLPRCVANRQQAERKVHESVDPGEVLNYVLLNGSNSLGTIRAFLSQQDWYVAAQPAFLDKAKANETASGFCRRIRNEITGLGLNGFDSDIVVWAVINGMPLPKSIDFQQVADCKAPLNTIAEHKRNAAESLARAPAGGQKVARTEDSPR